MPNNKTTTTFYDTPSLKLDAVVTKSSVGTTLEIYSTWPGAKHPDAMCKLSMTLPGESFAKLANVLADILQDIE
jgi:hypothetical protein